MDFNIKFNKDKNFLVGKNGSGKTTALKLINSLIVMDFKSILLIDFKNCYLLLEIDKKEVCIKTKKEKDLITFSVTGIESILKIRYRSDILLGEKNKSDRFERFLEDIKYKYGSHPVIEYISKIPPPVFLGIDRRVNREKLNKNYTSENEVWVNRRGYNILQEEMFLERSTSSDTMEIKFLVKNAYKNIRDLELKQTQALREQIIISSFNYIDFKQGRIFEDNTGEKERERLLKRESEIKKAIMNISDFDSSIINKKVEVFFERMNDMLCGMSSENKRDIEKNKFKIEFLLNKSQIERMDKIVDIIDEHKSRNDEYYKPINNFLDTVNYFYQDSGKRLVIDTVGQLLVKRTDGNEFDIEILSSGERQILIIFAHSYFNKNNIFIIDEPELSLHLGWQEKLADAISLANKESQFILATHSPEIIAGNKSKAVGCR